MKNSSQAGFTRTDLIFVFATLGGLLLLGGTAMATSSSETEATACMSNHQKLIDAWSHYAADNNGQLTATVSGGPAQAGARYEGPAADPSLVLGRIAPWTVGWLDWGSRPDNTNITYLTHPSYGTLALYLGRRAEGFRCPSDRILSTMQQSLGWTQRVRSYSANAFLGNGNWQQGDENFPDYVKVRKLSEMINPPPSSLYVFIEEHPDSLNDPAFFSPMGAPSVRAWFDLPANYHNGGANISFADGHVVQKQWQGGIRTAPVTFDYNSSVPPSSLQNQNDMAYLAERTPMRLQ